MKALRWGPRLRLNVLGLSALFLVGLFFSFDSQRKPPHDALANVVNNTESDDLSLLDGGAARKHTDNTRYLKKLLSGLSKDPATTNTHSNPDSGTSSNAGDSLSVLVPRHAANCGVQPSNYSELARFSAVTLPRRWSLNTTASVPGATLISTKRGPARNPSLCAEGCAVLSLTIPAGRGWGDGAIVDEWFPAPTNLNGALIRASVALEIPQTNLPVNVRIYTQGDSTSNYAWGTTASLATSTLADVSRFHDIVLHATDKKGSRPFCASAAGAIGIQVQRSRNTLIDIPVKLYLKAVAIGDEPNGSESKHGKPQPSSESPGHSRDAFDTRFDGKDGYCRLADNGSLSVATDDWVVAGSCQGYGYTFTSGKNKDTKISPACSASRCNPKFSKISTKSLCSSGTIAADSTWQSKAGLGVDFDPMKSQTSGLSLTYQMNGTALLRFILDDGQGNFFCVDLDETDEAGTTINLPWDVFSTRCWDRWNPGTIYHPKWPIKGVQLTASCLAEKSSWFDMCISGIATF
jgi:hypothetical protein